MSQPKQPIESRFWTKVDKSGECWIWTGAKSERGYGKTSINRQPKYSHRISYEMAYGSIAEDMVIDHICHTPACVRPEHLRAVTQKQNLENQSGAYKNSKSGIRGVSWSAKDKKWGAYVSHNKKMHFAGNYTDIQQAEAAVLAKRLELFTHNELDRQQQQAS